MDIGGKFDKSRDFSSLSALKISKKDRHNRAQYEFSKFLEATNEKVVQEVLLLSREFRETMETTDDELQKFCADINEDSFLIPRSERELIDCLDELKKKIQDRSEIVDKFGFDLDNTETKRAEITGTELKRLVDKLIAIAHQLPDDIEHIVEAEAFELNTEIITNKATHAQTVAQHQIRQIELETELLQKWEDTRVKWRNLRHEKALNDFRDHVASEEFTNPADRQSYMEEYRAGQELRQERMQRTLQRLAVLHNGDISSEVVKQIQAEFAEQNEEEMRAIQSCYDRLAELRSGHAFFAQDRVEALRRELHVYGALRVEPDREALALQLQAGLDDESLSELWRLGGGLKSEIQNHIIDLRSDDIIYERVVQSMQSRLELITCSFDLKSILEKRGRLAQLEKMRALITKMRTAPRAEVADVLRSMTPDLQSIEEVDQLPELFRSSVAEVLLEINEELESVERRAALSAAGGSAVSGISRTISESRSQSATSLASGRLTAGSAKTGRTGRTGMSESQGGVSAAAAAAAAVAACPDPALVKVWNRRLGILYFGADLPAQHQEACHRALQATLAQRECNQLVDAAVEQESADKLRRIDRRYEKSNECIATFLETRATQLSHCTTNICDFFLRVAKMVEEHRAEQKRLDEQSADEVWDLKEEFRLASEDREEAYQAACQKIRESTKQEELEEHFDEVLQVLETIQQSYRDYHSDACFAADRHPLMLMHDFRGYLDLVGSEFFLQLDAQHPIVREYGRVFDQTVRFNRKYFEENDLAAGVQRIGVPGAPASPVSAFSSRSDAADEAADALEAAERIDAGAGEATEAGDAAETMAAAVASGSKPLELLSPFMRDGREAPPDANCGRYFWRCTPDAVERRFREESAFAAAAGDEEPQTVSADDQAAAAGSPRAALLRRREPHPDYPYIAADSPILPLSADEVDQLHPEDREDYELSLLRHFLPLAEAGRGDAADAADAAMAVPEELASASEEQRQLYRDACSMYAAAKRRQAEQSTAEYIAAHPPLDPTGRPWVQSADVKGDQILSLFSGIRDSVISNLEQSSLKRTVAAERVSETSKQELTDQLEDRIRNHWPRRGRVETQIKQPREVELLSHKEKTWRHITSIQQKMIQAQQQFDALKEQCISEAQLYEQEMQTLTELLQADFSNLAALQVLLLVSTATTSSQCSAPTQHD